MTAIVVVVAVVFVPATLLAVIAILVAFIFVPATSLAIVFVLVVAPPVVVFVFVVVVVVVVVAAMDVLVEVSFFAHIFDDSVRLWRVVLVPVPVLRPYQLLYYWPITSPIDPYGRIVITGTLLYLFLPSHNISINSRLFVVVVVVAAATAAAIVTAAVVITDVVVIGKG